jgi:hypothetical protein
MTDDPRRRTNRGGMLVGLMIMLLGATLFLDRAGVIDGFDYVNIWPVAVIIIGLVKLSQRRDDGRREGGWWVFFGAWMLLNQMHVVRLRESWPLFLVALGVSMVWKEARARARVE